MTVKLKVLLNKLQQDALVKLADTIRNVHPDCVFDTSVTVTELRTNMATTLRSNPEFMDGIKGLENVKEYQSWSNSQQVWTDDDDKDDKGSTGSPETLQENVQPTVTTQATTPVTSTVSQTLPATIITSQQQLTAAPVVTSSVASHHHSNLQPTVSTASTSTYTVSSHQHSSVSAVTAPTTTTTAFHSSSATAPSLALTAADLTTLVTSILQQTSSQQQMPFQQTTSRLVHLLKEARHKSLSFGGYNDNLQRFLGKVETLFSGFSLTEDDKIRAIGDLLTADAEVWFESRKGAFSSYIELKEALKNTYLPRHHYTDLRRKIMTTRQSYNEKVSSFIAKIRVMNLELDDPIPSQHLIPVVTANLHHRFLPLIGMRETDIKTWEELESVCLRAESILEQQEKSQRFQKPSTSSRINSTEIEVEEEQVEEDVDVSAMDSSQMVCHNCKKKGHKYSECTQPKKLFCYRCGKAGVTSSVCSCTKNVQNPDSLVPLIEKVVAEVLKKQQQSGSGNK